VRRLGSPGVVGVGIHGPDDALAVDHEPGGDGQAPGAVAIAFGQVDTELEIDLSQVIGQGEHQPVLLRHAVAEVA
jgi:hypothetical protein